MKSYNDMLRMIGKKSWRTLRFVVKTTLVVKLNASSFFIPGLMRSDYQRLDG